MTAQAIALILVELLRSGACHPAMVDDGGIGLSVIECPAGALQGHQLPFTFSRVPMSQPHPNPMKWGQKRVHQS